MGFRSGLFLLSSARQGLVCVMTSAQIDELFKRTLVGDYEDDAPWRAVHELHRMGSREIFHKATEWCASQEPLVRARGLDILAQIGKTTDHPSNAFPEESFSIVASVLGGEQEIQPLDSAIAALGHLDNPAGVPLIILYKSHPHSNIRFSVACALGSFPNDSRSADCLLLLMEDADEEVRDWATFGLGVLGDLDSSDIRDALLQRLSDSNEDVRHEAIAALGKRRDQRVLPSLLAALEEPPVAVPVIEAACGMLNTNRDIGERSSYDYASALRERFGLQSGK